VGQSLRSAGGLQGRDPQSDRLVQGPGFVLDRRLVALAFGPGGGGGFIRKCRGLLRRLRRPGRDASPGLRPADGLRSEAQAGAAYASHACLPFNLPGYATLAYELFEQLGGRLPGAVLLPVGQGGLLLGLWRGFERLRAATQTQEAPRLIGVQARACAPLWALFTNGPDGLRFVAENPTLAEGVRVRYPLRGDAVLEAVRHSRGLLEAVDEAEIPAGRKALSRLGLNVEPTSAIVWPVLQRLLPDLPDTVVVVLTGSGDKFEPLH
jgi:threonine synthase